MAIAAGLLVAVAACGGDDSGSDTTSGGDATTAAPATTGGGDATTAAPDTTAGGSEGSEAPSSGDPIVIGGVADLSSFPGMAEGAQARFDRANEEGGVNGRQIDFIGVKDDGLVEANNLSAVRALVQNDHVDAVLPIASAQFTPGSSDFLTQNSTPYIGWGFMPGFCGADFGFGVNGCLINPDVVNAALVEPSIKELGVDPSEVKVAIQSNDDISGTSGNALYVALWEAKGAEVVYTDASLAAGTTDYTPYIQAIMENDPDIALISTQFGDSISLVGGLNAAGFDGLILSYINYQPGLLESQPAIAAALEGSFAMTQFPPQEGGGAIVEQILADLAASGADEFLSTGAAVGWWSADFYLAALEASGGDPAKVPDTLKAGFTYEGFAEGADAVWPELIDVALPCQAMMKVENAAYTVAQPFECYENIPLG